MLTLVPKIMMHDGVSGLKTRKGFSNSGEILVKKMNLENLLIGLEKGRVGAASKLISILEQGNDYEIDKIMEMI